jgi:Predicted membrane protein
MTEYTIEQQEESIHVLLLKELAPFSGRMDSVWRILICSALVITISMTLQVPFLALSLIMVFFTAQENTVLTKLSGIILIAGATTSIVLSICLLKYTMGYPAWRVLGACVIGFCGMYFMRISKLGAIGYMITIVTIYAQSLVDYYDNPEVLTRSLLWVWIAVVYPIVLTIIVNELFRPAQPVRLLTEEMIRQLNMVNSQLEARRTGTTISALSANVIECGALLLHRHLVFASQGNKAYGFEKGKHLMRIAALDRLHTAAAHLSHLPTEPLTSIQRERLSEIQASCTALHQSLLVGTTFRHPPILPDVCQDEDTLTRILREMAHAFHAFAEADIVPPLSVPTTKHGVVPDAFSNPVYGQFALKNILATMLCYVFYTAVQWPGIHTSMLTCIILALPSLGATSHKGLTRVIGCALGSVASVIATVFIIPHLDSLVGLLGLTLPVIAFGAWIAAGSARTNYIGVQVMFAFALALLGHFGPTTDLTEIRDRMLGILIGVAVSLFVSTMLWPEREGDRLKIMLGHLLRTIATLVKAGDEQSSEGEKRAAIDKARLQGWSLLSQNRELQARVALEPGWQYAHDSVTGSLTTWLAQAQEALFAVNYLQLQLLQKQPHLSPEASAAFNSFQNGVIQKLEWMANHFEGNPAVSTASQHPDPMAALADLQVNPTTNEAASKQLTELRAAAHAVYERITQLTIQYPPSLR